MTRPAGTGWPELDFLRGMAGLLMVLNHAGCSWLSAEQLKLSIPGLLVLLGSFAPVLFFSVTGLGYGVQAGGRAKQRAHQNGFLNKAIILLAADEAFRLKALHSWLGLSFLGFIALSMLVLELVRGSKSSRKWAAGLAAGIIAIRFGIGPALRGNMPADGGWHWLQFALGLHSVEGFGYPPAPWLAYPLAAFLLGSWAQSRRAWIASHRFVCVGVLASSGGLITATAIALAHASHVVHRWGTLSFTYFIAGFGVLALGLAASLVAAGMGQHRMAAWVSLRGVSSLAVVPAHYLVIECMSRTAVVSTTTAAFVASCSLAVVVSFLLARGLMLLTERLKTAPNGTAWWCVLASATACSILLLGTAGPGPRSGLALMVGAQAALCVLLVIRPPAFLMRFISPSGLLASERPVH